jgi:L-alanine-DL-glutamate epimerase-like enolase superfamily enzyme
VPAKQSATATLETDLEDHPLMKITGIETWRIAIPFTNGGPALGMRPGLAAWSAMEALIVRVQTDDGLVGWGEAFGHVVNAGTQAVLDTLVAPWFLGRDPGPIAPTMEAAQKAFHVFGRTGPVLYALSAMDIALWDLAGKRAGAPVFRMLGGTAAPLDLYASLMRLDGDQAAIADGVHRAMAVGYGWIKMHEATVPAFRAAREAAAAEARIMLDVNCPWAVDEAQAVAREILEDDFHWLEEPVWPPEDFAGIAEVRAEGVPIAAGENICTLHDFQRLFEARAVDFVQPSVIKVGGISAMQRIITLAQAYSVRVMPHCFYWGPGYLASAHVIAAMTRPAPLETAFITLEAQPHPLFNPAVGSLTLSEAPGLGFEPDMAVMERYRVSRTVLGG